MLYPIDRCSILHYNSLKIENEINRIVRNKPRTYQHHFITVVVVDQDTKFWKKGGERMGSDSIGVFDRNWLKARRIKSGMQSQQVAEAVGITKENYCRLENGTNKPGLMLAFKLSDLLGFDVREFAKEERLA